MKLALSLVVSVLFIFCQKNSSATNITDSVFLIQDDLKRIKFIEIEFNKYPIKSSEALLFKNEILKRGNESEKLIVQWMWEDRNLSKSNGDSSIDIFNKYLPEARKTGNAYILALLYSLKADALFNIGAYNKSVENHLYSYDNLKKDPEKEYYNATWILYNIAMNFYRFKDYEKTIEISNTVTRLDSPYNIEKVWFECNNYDLIGMAYFKSNRFDSAEYWFSKVYETAIKIKNNPYIKTAWMGIGQGNLGWLFYKQLQYEKSEKFLKSGIEMCTQTELWDNVAPFSACLSDVFIKKGQFAEAAKLLELCKDANDKYYKLENRLEYFKVAMNYEKSRSNFSKAFEYVDSIDYYEKLEAREFEVNKKALMESQLAFGNKIHENNLIQQKSRSEKILLYSLIIILFLIAAAAVLFIKRQKLRHSLAEEKLINEKLRAENELSLALYEIKEFSHNISQKNKAIEQLSFKVQNLEQKQSAESENKSKLTKDVIEITALRDEDWADFYIMFDKAFPGLQQKFRNKLPELNENELRYFMTLKISVPADEICAMLNTNEKGVAMLREELVQKLHLTSTEEIEILLESL